MRTQSRTTNGNKRLQMTVARMADIKPTSFAIELADHGHRANKNQQTLTMMSTMRNKVQLIGNLGRDPELKEVGKGLQRLRLSLATTERFKGSDGEWKDDIQWHTIVAWGKQAETLSARVKKGSGLMVEGRLVHRKYEKDGEPRYATEVVLAEYQLLAERSSAA